RTESNPVDKALRLATIPSAKADPTKHDKGAPSWAKPTTADATPPSTSTSSARPAARRKTPAPTPPTATTSTRSSPAIAKSPALSAQAPPPPTRSAKAANAATDQQFGCHGHVLMPVSSVAAP